jgi:tetratricopeptide (TPR) repeat protein
MAEIYKQLVAERGVILAEAGDWSKAKSDLEVGRRMKFWPELTAYHLARCYLESGDFQGSAGLLNEAIELGLPRDLVAYARFMLAFCLSKLEKHEEALEQLLLTEGSTGVAYVSKKNLYQLWGDTLDALGRKHEALQYRRLSEQPPS